MELSTRRRFLQTAVVASVGGTAGCLRSFEGSDATPTATSAGQDGDTTTQFRETRDELPVRVTDTWGPESQWEVRWEAEKLVVTCGDTDPAPDAAADEAVGATVDIATAAVDMSELRQVVYVYRHSSTPGEGVDRESARQDVSYFGIVGDPNNIGQKTIEDDNSELEPDNPDIDFSLYLKDFEDTGRVEREIDTTGIEGMRHMGVGANVGSDTPQRVTLEVFDIRGIGDSGETVFSFNPSAQRLELA